MHHTATVNTRINPSLKKQAENVFHKIGLSSAEAIRLFYKQVCLHRGLPFEVKIPNAVTRKAMHDADTGKTRKAKDIDEIFDGLE